MGFKDNGANRKMTDEELEQCRAVFRRLASLKGLRVLDTMSTQILSHRPEYPYRLQHPSVSLPIRLKAGLDELKTLTRLEMFHFWCGRHVIYRKEIEWMVDHWKRLRAVVGSWMVPVDSTLRSKFTLIQEMGPWLKGRGVTTIGRYYEDDLDWEAVSHDFEDCCGEGSSRGGTTIVRAQVQKPPQDQCEFIPPLFTYVESSPVATFSALDKSPMDQKLLQMRRSFLLRSAIGLLEL